MHTAPYAPSNPHTCVVSSYGVDPGNLTQAVEVMKEGQTHTHTEKLGPQMDKLWHPGSSVCSLHRIEQEGRVIAHS